MSTSSKKKSSSRATGIPEPGRHKPPTSSYRYYGPGQSQKKRMASTAGTKTTRLANYSPIGDAKFILSAPELKFCPDSELPEICLAGRSNVGKSSLVNALTNQNKLAKTSNVPGKTREMNYFLMKQRWHLVDLPGYGYARVPKREQERWKEALESYLTQRTQLRLVIIIVDIRHAPHASDLDFMAWLAHHAIPFALVLNKADKIGRNATEKARKSFLELQKNMNIEVPMIASSVETLEGLAELAELFDEFTQIE
ncbi:MAG: ribosome biogenesis GTP-binding protein YihA/YsxC [Cyclonatronaceae bacterium]